MALDRTVVKIAYTDGRVVSYPVTPRIEVNFERKYKIGVSKIDAGNEGATNLYRLAWDVQYAHVEDMPGGVIPDFDTWIDTVEALDTVREAVGPFPKDQQNAAPPS